MKLLVCGGRDYDDRKAVFAALDRVHRERGIDLVIHGAASGADRLAGSWADVNYVRVAPYPVLPKEWQTSGKKAGPLRNKQMLEWEKPDGVVAFPGGRGTADMIRQAKRAGVPVWEPFR